MPPSLLAGYSWRRRRGRGGHGQADPCTLRLPVKGDILDQAIINMLCTARGYLEEETYLDWVCCKDAVWGTGANSTRCALLPAACAQVNT